MTIRLIDDEVVVAERKRLGRDPTYDELAAAYARRERLAAGVRSLPAEDVTAAKDIAVRAARVLRRSGEDADADRLEGVFLARRAERALAEREFPEADEDSLALHLRAVEIVGKPDYSEGEYRAAAVQAQAELARTGRS